MTEEIPDFSKPRTRVAFKIDNDIFEAPPAIPAMVLMDYAKRFNTADAEKLDPEEQLKIMMDLLSVILRPVSYDRFIERLSDQNEPIELDQVQTSIEYLMGKYGMRPTQLPSTSSPGPVDQAGGMSLTGSTPVAVSTSESYV
jgi:hypothetical protein